MMTVVVAYTRIDRTINVVQQLANVMMSRIGGRDRLPIRPSRSVLAKTLGTRSMKITTNH